jgi:membrane protein DedA with SNARE-associated domain
LTSTFTHLFTTYGYLAIFLAMAVESCCIPLPSELVMPLAGFLAYQHRLNLFGDTVAGALGCVLGSIVAYWIGAREGRPLLLRYGKYIMISHHDAYRADRFFEQYGDITIFLTRLMPIVRTFISLPAGIARMDFKKFVLFTLLGSLPWCFILAFAGYKLGENWNEVGSTLHKYDAVVLVVAVLLVALYIYNHVRRMRSYPQGEAEAE